MSTVPYQPSAAGFINMRRYASPEKQGKKQAASIIKSLQGRVIKSVGTARDYESALTVLATELARQKINLKDLTVEMACAYLDMRSEQVRQSTLDADRLAIQVMLQKKTHKLEAGQTLPVVKSEVETILAARAYSPEQAQYIAQFQRPQNALSTEIAYAAGLRAHELFTLRPVQEQTADIRPALPEKFLYRPGIRYTVIGKGGLIREVQIPYHLAERLEARRLPSSRIVKDRGIYYRQYYALQGGKNWSQSVTRISQNRLGWSHGAHGFRHSYAQDRMDELRSHGINRSYALEVVSQEMGHFRSDITEIYLR